MATEWLHADALKELATLSFEQLEAANQYADDIAGSTIAMAQALQLERPYFESDVLRNLLSSLVVADVAAARALPDTLWSPYHPEVAQQVADDHASAIILINVDARAINEENPRAGVYLHEAIATSALLHHGIFNSGHLPGALRQYAHPFDAFQKRYCEYIYGDMLATRRRLPSAEEMSAWWELPPSTE